jgi:hypothetical protein
MEDYPVQCHLWLWPAALPDQQSLPEAVVPCQVFAFRKPRAYSAQELRRLSSITRLRNALALYWPLMLHQRATHLFQGHSSSPALDHAVLLPPPYLGKWRGRATGHSFAGRGRWWSYSKAMGD